MHGLDFNTTPERQLLDSIQPLFANSLPWALQGNDSHKYASGRKVADDINAQKLKTMFLDEMVMIHLHIGELPNRALSPPSFQSCLETSSDLLAFLETLVHNNILNVQVPTAPRDDRPVEDEHTQVAGIQLVITLVSKWLSQVPEPKNITSSTTETRADATAKNDSEAHRISPDAAKYPKLEAIARLLEGSSDRETCQTFIDLHQNLAHFEDGIQRAWHLNKCLSNLNRSPPTKRFRPLTAQRIPRTQWENKTPWDLSSRLFQRLYSSTCQIRDHEVKLQLNGFDLDSFVTLPIHFNLFLSSCPTNEHWHECQCRAISPRKLNSLGKDVEMIVDLCEDIRILGHHQHPSPRLGMHFEVVEAGNRYYLWRDAPDNEGNTRQQYGGAVPTVSLDHLIRHGFLTDVTDGGLFGMNDKAVLALSLARCFVHLWGTNWLIDPWTADNIHFLASSDEIRNPHHPFVHCSLNTTGPSTQSRARQSLFSFAQLLLEIETGTRIDVDISSADEDEFEDTIADILESRGDRFGRREYNAAVAGCFHVFALVNKQRNSASGTPDELSIMRKAIYDAIIEPLEQNFNQIPNPAKALYVKRLHLGQKGGSYGLASFHQQREPPGRRGSPHVGDTAAFFDGETLATYDERVVRATRFFDSMDLFHTQFIQPKATSSNGLKRVKIAILDTGIEVENSSLQGVLDNIKHSRKDSGFRDWRKSPIRAVQSFTTSPDSSEKDIVGHGTHVAWLTLKTAPDVDLYIAKVSCGKQFDDTAAVVKAINWALDQEVDIMVMSFGSSYIDRRISDAIDHATITRPHPTLVFAAASNSGLNSRPTFPATHDKVIGIYSLDGYGNDNGGLNPSRQPGDTYFGTLGVGIEMLWDDKKEARSGSSYAAPIAAGIAANCLVWLEDMLTRGFLSQEQYKWLRTIEGMRYMLRKQAMGSNGDKVGILSLAPWVLWRRDFTDVEVCALLKEGVPLFR